MPSHRLRPAVPRALARVLSGARPPRPETPALAISMPSAAVASLTAYFLVTAGSCIQGDLRFLLGVPLTVAGFASASVAVVRARRVDRLSTQTVVRLSIWLSVLAAIGVGSPSLHGDIWYEVAFRAYPALALVLIGVYVAGDSVWRGRAVWALVAGAVVLQAVTPIGVRPFIDVWNWTQTCTRALLHGVQPYTDRAPDLYAGAFDYGSTPPYFPYMPLVLIANAPALALFGDYRFGLAVCLPATIALLRGAGRRLAVDPEFIDLLTVAFVLHPRAASLTGLGFTEPLVVLVLAAFVFLSARSLDGWRQATAFFLLPSLKQYVAAPILMYVAMRPRPRAVAIGAAVAAMTVVPFLIWRWPATLDGILFLVRSPLGFRIDSDSLTALVAQVTGVEAPRWIGISAQFVVGAIAFELLRHHGLSGLLLASALAMLASFLLATQAFVNYYYFVGALLLFATLALARRAPAVA